MYKLVRKEEYDSVHELLEHRQAYINEYRSVQTRMKDIQNEIDHLVYKIYGITDPEDIAELEQPLYKRPWKEPDAPSRLTKRPSKWDAEVKRWTSFTTDFSGSTKSTRNSTAGQVGAQKGS